MAMSRVEKMEYGHLVILYRTVREDLPEKMTTEKRIEGMREERRESKHIGSEGGACLGLTDQQQGQCSW
jgi:hypothetical protein